MIGKGHGIVHAQPPPPRRIDRPPRHPDGNRPHQALDCRRPLVPRRRNHRRIADAKRYADGLLVGDEIRAIRTQFDLSQQEAAELFGGGVNAFSKYERGDVLQSVAMDRLLRATAFYPFLIEFLREEARIAAGASGRVEVARYQAGPSLDMRDKAYRSRSVGGAVVVVEGGLHWQRGRAA